MGIPPLSAESGLYRSENHYLAQWSIAFPSVGDPPPRLPKPPIDASPHLYDLHDLSKFYPIPAPRPTPFCLQGTIQCKKDGRCYLDTCGPSRYFEPTTCTCECRPLRFCLPPNFQDPYTCACTTCPQGTILCKKDGMCYLPNCQWPRYFEPSTCNCECRPCPYPRIPDWVTCACKCGFGTTDCSGSCVNLQIDASHCGSC